MALSHPYGLLTAALREADEAMGMQAACRQLAEPCTWGVLDLSRTQGGIST